MTGRRSSCELEAARLFGEVGDASAQSEGKLPSSCLGEDTREETDLGKTSGNDLAANRKPPHRG